MTSEAAGVDSEYGRSLRRISTPMTAARPAGSNQLLVGHDSHPASRAAVLFTAGLASRLGAYLHVVHVVDLADTPIDANSSDWEDAARQALLALHEEARLLVGKFTIDWTYHACRGDPAELLARVAAENAVMLVAVGATGHSLTRRLLEGGSVSRRLLRRADTPVLIVPELSLVE